MGHPPKGEAETPESDALHAQRPPRCTADCSAHAKESATAFPPLKSAIGGVVAIWDIAGITVISVTQDLPSARSTPGPMPATLRCGIKDTADLIANAVPDGSEIPPPMQQIIERFTYSRREHAAWRPSGFPARPLPHAPGDNERTITNITTRLDDQHHDILVGPRLPHLSDLLNNQPYISRSHPETALTLQIELQQVVIASEQAKQRMQTQCEIQQVSAVVMRLPPPSPTDAGYSY
ncbi:hypothetical protein C8J57DRAFT_1534721 [Mycena rebaudengoi]|nr:hypothetical protein C8J57DRAFT_1534721 [Mycena rebaudengoi]